jgi:hypothetical protein
MDVRELRYFAAVFQERNLTVAAKRCFISQPSVSVAITNLEAELGTTLFIGIKKVSHQRHRRSSSIRLPVASLMTPTQHEICSGNRQSDSR